MSVIISKQHDTKIKFTDTPKIDGVPIPPEDLAGCTLSFIMKQKNGQIAIKQPAVITPGGTFEYEPEPEDVAEAGKFQQEWELVYPSGKILTFPNDQYNLVTIKADLG
jgi:hypothetical protein